MKRASGESPYVIFSYQIVWPKNKLSGADSFFIPNSQELSHGLYTTDVFAGGFGRGGVDDEPEFRGAPRAA